MKDLLLFIKLNLKKLLIVIGFDDKVTQCSISMKRLHFSLPLSYSFSFFCSYPNKKKLEYILQTLDLKKSMQHLRQRIAEICRARGYDDFTSFQYVTLSLTISKKIIFLNYNSVMGIV